MIHLNIGLATFRSFIFDHFQAISTENRCLLKRVISVTIFCNYSFEMIENKRSKRR